MNLTKDLILGLEHELIRAITTSDIIYLGKILHEDLLFIAPNGEMVTKAMDMSSHRAGNMKVEQLAPTFEEVKLIEDTAVVVVVYHTRGTMLGNPIEGKFRYIRVWKQFSDGPKIIGGSCLKIE